MSSPEHQRTVIIFLQREWQTIVSGVPRNVRVWLSMPQIIIARDLTSWGRWTGFPMNTIEIRESLVEEHPLYALLEVFRHEVAHQVCDAVGGDDESPHGKTFRRVCEWIGANPAASGDFTPLDVRVFGQGDERNPVTEKLKKLMALSESPNRHEAETALKKAREFAARHEIGLQDGTKGGSSEFCCISIGRLSARRSREQVLLAGFLQDFYQVMSVWCYEPFVGASDGAGTPASSSRQGGYRLYVFGTLTAVKIASYVHDFLMNFFATADLPASMRENGAKARRDFAIGVMMGLRETMEAHSRTPEMMALVEHGGGHGMQEAFGRMFPRLRTTHVRSLQVSREAVEHGRRTGRELVIPKGVEREGTAAPRRLNAGK